MIPDDLKVGMKVVLLPKNSAIPRENKFGRFSCGWSINTDYIVDKVLTIDRISSAYNEFFVAKELPTDFISCFWVEPYIEIKAGDKIKLLSLDRIKERDKLFETDYKTDYVDAMELRVGKIFTVKKTEPPYLTNNPYKNFVYLEEDNEYYYRAYWFDLAVESAIPFPANIETTIPPLTQERKVLIKMDLIYHDGYHQFRGFCSSCNGFRRHKLTCKVS